MNLAVKVKILQPDAQLPTYAHEGDAGFDLISLEDKVLAPGERYLFALGLAFELPAGCVALLHRRSGLAAKYGIIPVGTGVIDANYRGEWKVPIINLSQAEYTVKKGDRIAQALIQPVLRASFEQAEELTSSEREAGGFGSTGR